jgi:esterase
MILHHEVISSPQATRSVLFLHGILGSGSNLRAHAKRLQQADPRWQVVLVDLRAHGLSLDEDGIDDVQNCARDIAQLCHTLFVPVEAIVGHSFGGKVALLCANKIESLKHIMTWDSAPGIRLSHRGSELTLGVLSVLHSMSGPWPKREDFVSEIVAKGFSKSIGQWLGMNLQSASTGFVFRLNLNRIESLLNSYFETDAWPVIEQMKNINFHLVIGSQSIVYDKLEIARASQIKHCTVDSVNAGHWVHVDAAEEVARILVERLC